MLKKILGTAVGLALTAALAGAAAAETYTVSTYITPKHWLVSKALAQWAADLAKESQGRVTVNILQTPLGKPEAHFDLARDGIADITLGIPGYTAGRFVLTEVGGLPNIGDWGLSRSVALWRVLDKFPEARKEFEGVEPLGIFTTTPMHMWNTKREIKTIDDFKGLKIHVAGGVMSDVANSLGIVPVAQPVATAYEVISRGVVDGIIFTRNGVHSVNLAPLIKYATIVPGGLTAAPIFLVMNQAKFDKMSAADKAALKKVSGEHLSRIVGNIWDAVDKEGIEAVQKAGGKIDTADAKLTADIRAATKPVVEKWLAEVKAKRGIDGAAVLATYEAAVKAVEAEKK
ncbi:MAG: TRAP transporter substrate-binding protein [Vicinamibacterales bacterium]